MEPGKVGEGGIGGGGSLSSLRARGCSGRAPPPPLTPPATPFSPQSPSMIFSELSMVFSTSPTMLGVSLGGGGQPNLGSGALRRSAEGLALGTLQP